MSDRERVAVLRAVRELASCDDAELSALAHFVDEARVPAGTVLAEEGRLCHELVIVAEGVLEARCRGVVVSLGPGDTLGWDAMRNRGRHEATVRTASPAHLLVMSHEQFRAAAALAVTTDNPRPKRKYLFWALPSSRRPLPQPARLAASVGRENRCSNPGC
jgi:CRP-like cAMP-binding protein